MYLKEGTQKLMILNRGSVIENNGENLLFDYSAAIYPVGLNPEQVLYFNKEDIDKIVFEGYTDEEEERFMVLFEAWLANEGSKMTKGKTV
ncbi:type II secretion protein [Lactococcus piscium]|uniref:Type II secretion protein n=1 Tax=Pseudolactococcus piscium TaxID=1364 RepID=A0A2A5RUE0_9LACT|nr:type II secretion protein [Lactococcus piscium]